MKLAFDSACRLAERSQAPTLRALLDQAALVVLPAELEPAHIDPIDVRDGFRLLHPVVAYECSTHVCVLRRLGREDPASKHLQGWPAIDATTRCDEAAVGLQDGDILHGSVAMSANGLESLVSASLVVRITEAGKVRVHPAGPVHIAQQTRHGFAQSTHHPVDDEVGHSYWTAVVGVIDTSLVHAAFAAGPSCWVLKAADGPQVPHQGKKIARAHQRPQWIVITSEERTRYFRESDAGQTDGADRAVAGHSRRAHHRRVGKPDELRFTWVRSCWVGPTETTIGRRRYRVELGRALS